MIYYNLRNEDGQEIMTDSESNLAELQNNGYKLMSIVNLSKVSKCKEGNV